MIRFLLRDPVETVTGVVLGKRFASFCRLHKKGNFPPAAHVAAQMASVQSFTAGTFLLRIERYHMIDARQHHKDGYVISFRLNDFRTLAQLPGQPAYALLLPARRQPANREITQAVE